MFRLLDLYSASSMSLCLCLFSDSQKSCTEECVLCNRISSASWISTSSAARAKKYFCVVPCSQTHTGHVLKIRSRQYDCDAEDVLQYMDRRTYTYYTNISLPLTEILRCRICCKLYRFYSTLACDHIWGHVNIFSQIYLACEHIL